MTVYDHLRNESEWFHIELDFIEKENELNGTMESIRFLLQDFYTHRRSCTRMPLTAISNTNQYNNKGVFVLLYQKCYTQLVSFNVM